MRTCPAPALALAVGCMLTAAAGAARADVDVEIANGDTVVGTLSPADEVETFRVRVPEGAVLSIAAKGRKIRGEPTATVTFRVLRPGGAGEAAPLQATRGTGARLKGLRATESGLYAIEVQGTGGVAGEYQVQVKWKSPKSVPISEPFEAGRAQVQVPADALAIATFLVKAGRGTSSQPALERLTDGGVYDHAFDAPAPGATSHKVAGFEILAAGTLDLSILDRNVGATPGSVKGKVTIRPPKASKRTIEIRDAATGGSGGGEVVFGQVVGPAGATVDAPAGTPIDGASVDVPAGALGSYVAIFVGTSSALSPPDGAGPVGAAGPPVFFGPAGTQFSASATVTIPIDLVALGGDTSAVRIFTRDEDGVVTEILPIPPATTFDFDLVAGTISFPASHFSSFQAFGPAMKKPLPWDLDGDGKAELVIPAREDGNGAGAVFVFDGAGLASGTSADADVRLVDSSPGQEFGWRLTSGDVDADGRTDLLVVRRGTNRAVLVFRGRVGGLVGVTSPAIVLSPPPQGPNIGSPHVLGDVNGDGRADVIVGDEGSARGGSAASGALFVFFGPLAANRDTSEADIVITGEGPGDLLGAAAAVGDVSQPSAASPPGVPDLVIAADQEDTTGPGKVYVFRGPVAPGTRSASTADIVLTGETDGDGFGLRVAAGDVTGDGAGDLIAASAGFDVQTPSLMTDTGRVYAIAGGLGLSGGSAGSAGTRITGVSASGAFGARLVLVNADGDQRGDVLVGAISLGEGGPVSGSVHLFLGSSLPGALTASDGTQFQQEGTEDSFGELLAPADLNGDGKDDLIFAATTNGAGGANAGAVYVFFGRPTFSPSYRAADADVIVRGAAGQFLGGALPD